MSASIRSAAWEPTLSSDVNRRGANGRAVAYLEAGSHRYGQRGVRLRTKPPFGCSSLAGICTGALRAEGLTEDRRRTVMELHRDRRDKGPAEGDCGSHWPEAVCPRTVEMRDAGVARAVTTRAVRRRGVAFPVRPSDGRRSSTDWGYVGGQSHERPSLRNR